MKDLKYNFITIARYQEYGGVSAMFAIMFPALLLFYSVAFDGASFQSSKARLVDGTNQGALAIAMMDNRNVSREDYRDNIALLHNYLAYYVPEATIDDNKLIVKVRNNYSKTDNSKLVSVDYLAQGQINMRPMLSEHNNVNVDADFAAPPKGFDRIVHINSDGSGGTIRRTIEEKSNPTDYVMVLDFSGSMRWASDQPGLSRIELLKKVSTEFIKAIFDENGGTNTSTVGIVPFTSGVIEILPGESIAGGKNFGCSYVGKFVRKYANLDLDFWYNKKYDSSSRLNTNTYYTYDDDNKLYSFYRNIVSPATGYTLDQMVDRGWCVKNSSSGSSVGLAPYSCDADPRSSLFKHKTEYDNNLFVAKDFMENAWKYLSIFNMESMDIAGLVNGDDMFSDSSIVTFKYLLDIPSSKSAFTYDCRALSEYIHDTAGAINYLKDKSAMPPSYLIELTNNRNIINQINDMQITVGATAVSLGLLRSLPVIAKGKNPRKAIIVISDGLDSDVVNNVGNLTERLFVNYDLCNRIKEGLKHYPAGTPTKDVDMFFIFTVNDKDTESALRLWREKCTGRENTYLATNYQDLLNVLLAIKNKYTVNFINGDE